MLFRYRARNFPQSLSSDEQAQWRQHCKLRWFGEGFNYASFCSRIDALRIARGAEPRAAALLDALQHYGANLCEAT